MTIAPPARPIRLYRHALSGHAHRVELFLSLLGLPYVLADIDLAAGAHRQPEFLKLNPYGQVPVIDDDGLVLADSNAILVYLATRYDADGWLPRDPIGAARVQRWLSLAAGPIAHGPAAARLVTLFGAKLDHAHVKRVAEGLFVTLDAELAGRHFALGDRPTIADIAGYSYIAHAPEGGVSLEPYPNLRAWVGRIEALPGFVAMPASKVGLVAA